MSSAINWFEIPSVDFDRAVTFYSTVLGAELRRGEFMGVPHGFFPSDETGVGGALIYNSEVKPASEGSLIYLNAPDLDGTVGRVAQAGGEVLVPVTSIGEMGRIAIIRDSEGNRVGLHSEV